MADVFHRTNGEYHKSVHTPDYPTGDWLVNPDLSALAGIVAQIYWKVAGETVVEMTQAEKDAVDAAAATALIAALESDLKSALHANMLSGLTVTATLAGLVVTANVTGATGAKLVDNDVTTVVADTTDTKFLELLLVYNSTSDAFSIVAREKTTGEYASLASDETSLGTVGEWSVAANGTTLVVV